MEYIESEWEYLQNPKEFSNVRSTNVNVDIENILIQRENQYKIVMQLTVENLTKKDMKKLRNSYLRISLYCTESNAVSRQHRISANLIRINAF